MTLIYFEDIQIIRDNDCWVVLESGEELVYFPHLPVSVVPTMENAKQVVTILVNALNRSYDLGVKRGAEDAQRKIRAALGVTDPEPENHDGL